MSSPPTAPAPERTSPGAWRMVALRQAGRVDVLYLGVVLALAALALWSGNAASGHLSPDGAKSVSRLLDELELPRTLPNAVLTKDDGSQVRLWDLTKGASSIVTFYAPWCGPCQEELPVLVGGTSSQPDRLTVIVGADEEAAAVRKQLDNLGLKELRFYLDLTSELTSGARVTALPTTFLVGRVGRVRERLVGSSTFRLQMLLSKATSDEAGLSENVD